MKRLSRRGVARRGVVLVLADEPSGRDNVPRVGGFYPLYPRPLPSSRRMLEATEECAMKPSTKDQLKGKLENLKGKLKEAAGVVTGQRKLENEGKDQQLAGKAREKLGQVEKVVGK